MCEKYLTLPEKEGCKKSLTSKIAVLYYCSSGAWCSGLTCGPVKAEIAGSNPVAPAKKAVLLDSFFFSFRMSAQSLLFIKKKASKHYLVLN